MHSPLTRFDAAAQAGAASGRTVTQVGPFTLTVDQESDSPHRNYATLDVAILPADPDTLAEAVDELISQTRAADRIPRIEFVPELAPGLTAVLMSAGFVVQKSVPILVCEPTDLVEPTEPHDVSIDVRTGPGTPDWFTVACSNTLSRSFGEPLRKGGPDISRMQKALSEGGFVALAREGCGSPAGAGRCDPPRHGVAELNSIGVLSDMRGQGIGAALTAGLSAAAFQGGATLCALTADDEAAQRLYERLGYRKVGEQLHVWIPPI